MNQDSDKAETITVDVYVKEKTDEGIKVILTETDKDTGIFEGDVFFTETKKYSGNRLKVSEGDKVYVDYTYFETRDSDKIEDMVVIGDKAEIAKESVNLSTNNNDDYYEDNKTETINSSIKWLDELGADYTIDGFGVIEMVHPGLNVSQQLIDIPLVHVWSDTDPQGIQVEAIETGADTGMFYADVDFVDEGSSHLSLQVSNGDTVTASFVDGLSSSSSSEDYDSDKQITDTVKIIHKYMPPLKQMSHGATMDGVICKASLVKLYKLSSSGHHSNVVCVKSTSVDKLMERGYSVAVHTPSSLSKSLDEFTISDELKKTIREKVDDGTYQSVFVGIIDNEGVERYHYGTTAKGEDSIDENTIFEIGSISKVFTSLILADMVLNNEISLDDSIDKFLPETVKPPTWNGDKITLLDLATHTSGLPVMPNYPPNPDLDKEYEYDKEGLYQYLSDFQLSREIGSQYEYSNTGGSLLGHVLSLHAEKSYEHTLKERILDKLGLDSTCVNQCDELRDRFATPHSLGEEADEAIFDDAMAGAGGVRSSGNDMLAFLSYAMDLDDSELQPAFELAQTPNHQINEILYTGLGWAIIDNGERNIVWHNGATHGFASFVGYDSDSEQGVVVLTNSQALVDEIGLDVLDFSIEE